MEENGNTHTHSKNSSSIKEWPLVDQRSVAQE